MRSAFRPKSPRYPHSWDDFPAGEHIRDTISEVCEEYAQRIFGYHFVKLGSLSASIPLTQSPIRNIITQAPHRVSNSIVQANTKPIVANESDGGQAYRKRPSKFLTTPQVIGQSHVLPYSENSIDGFLLANELDFAQDPHEILREVDRVVTQSGYVIISGFNPLSLAGIGKFLPVKRNNILHDARFFTSYRIKDWLQLLGFEIVEQRQVMFSTLFFQPRSKHALTLQRYLSEYLPWCSAVYVILARKREIPMTTISLKRKAKPQFAPMGASARTPSLRQR
ncbi:class I SAM-dependent methyltransferase [Alteromonas sp.]|nr:class I SAM-dependent methyltransferase [Alteromonas sp.]